MKKILLSLMGLTATIFSFSQDIVLNELYPDPGSNKDEYIELYNTSATAKILDCYTLVSYNVSNNEVYVYQLPNVEIAPYGFFLFTSSTTFAPTPTTQLISRYGDGNNALRYPIAGQTATNIKSWNIDDASSSLSRYTINAGNNGFNLASGTFTTTDFLPIANGNSANTVIFLFNGNDLINGFSSNGSFPTIFSSLVNDITVTKNLCTTSFNFAGIDESDVELSNVGPAGGKDNGYYRTKNGLCGTWTKMTTQYSPGTSNGGVATGGVATVIATSGPCGPTVDWSVSITVTDPAYLNASYYIYEDVDNSLTINTGDNLVRSGVDAITTTSTYNVTPSPITITKNKPLLVQVVSAAGCLTYFQFFTKECSVLPVHFKSFNASRTTTSNVSITWTTASEQNSKGFNVQKNVGGEWKTIAFVPSQALGGNSSYDINYSFKDANTEKGITQYRVQQVDLDGKFAYTDIRAIRGEGTVGKIIVYPNPSADGKVNVVFEDNTVRDIQVNDMQGKVIKSYKGITNNILVIEKLTSGFYTIKITNRNTAASSVEKVVVK
jgi:hypothetical protein